MADLAASDEATAGTRISPRRATKSRGSRDAAALDGGADGVEGRVGQVLAFGPLEHMLDQLAARRRGVVEHAQRVVIITNITSLVYLGRRRDAPDLRLLV